MTLNLLSSLFLGFFAVSSNAAAFVEGNVSTGEPATRFEPQIAMVCRSRSQYYAQYMGEDGMWLSDANAKVTCLKKKIDILQFCKQVYPHRDITNIVEASRFYKVPNFCRVGHSKCKTSIFVKPYRCLEGSFQSDALLVPEGCLFDHIHNQSRCWEFDRWNGTASKACQARSLSLKAFAMLLPCGIDLFSGVEFVCCPNNYKNHGKAHAMEVEEPLALPQVDHRVDSPSPSSSSASRPPAASPHQDTTTTPQEISTRDEYFGRFDPHEEHDAFRKAEQRLEQRHREKVSKIMKEWSELEERYQSLHAKDPSGAEKFKDRMTQRFQQTVRSVEAQNEAEKHQLTALHQQRIVAHINEMKREAMTCYTSALAQQLPNTHKVQKCLQRLLRALNKDRHHSVSHFKHLLNTDYEAADRERDATLQHLADLDRMVNQSLNMLARKPELFAKIGRLMHEYATTLRSKDVTPPELTPATPTVNEEAELKDDDSDEDDDDYDDEEDEDEVDEEEEEEDEEEDELEDEEEEDEEEETEGEETDDDKDSAELESTATEVASASLSSSQPAARLHTQPEPHVAHAKMNLQSHDASFTEHLTPASESRGVYFTLAFAGVALMGALVIGIIVLRRRSAKHPANQGFMEVDQAATPEEKHVTNMQVNGYENPTYKYFEK